MKTITAQIRGGGAYAPTHCPVTPNTSVSTKNIYMSGKFEFFLILNIAAIVF